MPERKPTSEPKVIVLDKNDNPIAVQSELNDAYSKAGESNRASFQAFETRFSKVKSLGPLGTLLAIPLIAGFIILSLVLLIVLLPLALLFGRSMIKKVIIPR